MRKLNRTSYFLLSLPALILVGFGLYRPKAAPPFSFRGASVASIPLKERNRANPLYPDTRVTIRIARKKLSFINSLWKERFITPQYKSTYLLDAAGRKYTFLKDHAGSSYVGNVFTTSIANDGIGISFVYQFHLAQIPQSAGKLTFKSAYLANDGFELPVSVVVRS